MHGEQVRAPMIPGFVAAPPGNPAAPETLRYPKIGGDEPAAYVRNFVVGNNNNNNIAATAAAAAGNDVRLFNPSAAGSVAVDRSRLPSPPLPLSVNGGGAGGYRTANPMMERLLQLVSSSPRPSAAAASAACTSGGGATLSATFPSLPLSQNWCAKCNTSFRMTSDLVYHMRTQHKRDLDPTAQGRRKDTNKLRCDVCGETFKERHHLTRHMTSHT